MSLQCGGARGKLVMVQVCPRRIGSLGLQEQGLTSTSHGRQPRKLLRRSVEVVVFAGGQSTSADPWQAAVMLLLDRLLEAWSECTPGQLADTPEAAAVDCCQAILKAAGLLLNRLHPGMNRFQHTVGRILR